jgi:hypothetical protein
MADEFLEFREQLTYEGEGIFTLVTTSPTVLKSRDGTIIVVGKVIDHSTRAGLRSIVGPGEAAVEIPFDVFEDAVVNYSNTR